MGKKVKNKDIAERLGVSGTLVSLVLNNKADQHGIRKDTQEKVLTLARQLGYFDLLKDKMESSPIEDKPGVIGMIVPSTREPYVYELLPFLQKAFASIGVGFSLITKDPDDNRYARLVTSFRKFYSGLILVGEAADDNTIRSLRATGYPFVLLEKSVNQMRLNTVCSDLNDGAERVVNHIVKMGYRNIMILTGRNGVMKDINLIDLLKTAIKNRESLNKPVIIEVDELNSGSEVEFSQVEKYLRPPFSTEVIVALHAENVYQILTTFRRKKVRIPQDVALISMEEGIGFDLLYTPVTSLRKPMTGMALKVANMIWAEVRNSGKSKYKRQVNLSPELIIRNSCGTI